MTNTPIYQALRDAAAVISAQCDGAVTDDSVGWNATDTVFGKAMSMLPLEQWDADVAAAAWQTLYHYRKQLKRAGVDFHSIPQPEEALGMQFGRRKAIRSTTTARAADKIARESTLTLEDGLIVLRSPYDKDLIVDIKNVPGREWDSTDAHWSFPTESVRVVWDMASKYQIAMSGDVRDLEDVTPVYIAPPLGLEIDGDRVHMRFDYSQEMTIAVRREVPGAVWSGVTKTWSTPTVNLPQALKFAQRFNLTVQDGLIERMQEEKRLADERHKASFALDADIDIPGMAPGMALLPYQRAGVAYALSTRRVMICDEMGLGKSIQALAAVVADNSLPVVCVVKNTLKLTWADEVEKFFPHLSTTVVYGTKPKPIEEASVIIVNYDIVAQRADDLLALEPAALIVDESHAIKNGKAKYRCPECQTGCQVNTKNCSFCHAHFDNPEEVWTVRRTEGVMRLARAVPEDGLVLLLSGTPITNRPAELIPQLIAIDQMKPFGGRWKFQQRYAPGGTGATNLVELNQIMRSRCYIRRTNEEVNPELPALRNSKQLLVVDNEAMKEYRHIEADVVDFLAKRAAEIAADEGGDPTAAYWEKRLRAEAAEHLVRISVLRNAVAEMKEPAVVDWIETFFDDSDQKLLVFGEHVSMVERMATYFEGKSVKIRGGVSPFERNQVVKQFQTDPATRLFVGNMAAASEGLTMTASHNVAFMELGWTPAIHAQCAARCYGRANDAHGATAWYLIVPRTIDEEMFQILMKKEQVVNAATNGTEVAKQGSILSDLVVALAKRGLAQR